MTERGSGVIFDSLEPTAVGAGHDAGNPPNFDGLRRPGIFASAASGTVGSLLAEVVLFPLDTVKLQVQTSGADTNLGPLGVMVHIIRSHGIGGLYPGISVSMMKESVHSFNYWVFHTALFRLVSEYDDTSKTPAALRLLVNLLAKQLNWLCTVPFEVVSSVNQLTPGSPGFFATARRLHAEGGIAAFYRGLPVSLVLAINPAIMRTLITSQLGMLARLRQAKGEDYVDARDHGPAAVASATAVAKTVATLLTYPLIRAKVLQQTVRGGQGLPRILRAVMAEEGVGGLYRGVLAMSYKTVVWNALMMAFTRALGPARAMTPPASPMARPTPRMRMPTLGREPFPVELLTPDVLGELIERMAPGNNRRMVALERRVDEVQSDLRRSLGEVTSEVREVRRLVSQLVNSNAVSQ